MKAFFSPKAIFGVAFKAFGAVCSLMRIFVTCLAVFLGSFGKKEFALFVLGRGFVPLLGFCMTFHTFNFFMLAF